MPQANAHAPEFLAVGEGLIDLISLDLIDSLDSAAVFNPYAGGQPSNLCAAVARLGRRAAIACCIGDDAFGRLYLDQMRQSGVLLDFVQVSRDVPTTTAVVSRNLKTPDFIIFRGADNHLRKTPELTLAAGQARLFHTSAFALARRPGRDVVLELMTIAREGGATITFDPNYHPSVWPDIPDFRELVLATASKADITKPSLEDTRRLFGEDAKPEESAVRLLEAGVKFVILTMGAEGTLVAFDGRVQMHLPSRPQIVVDVTGAGDSFWAGFVTAYLEGRPMEKAVCFGQAVAEMKLGYTGPLRPIEDFTALGVRAEEIYKQLSSRAGTST